MPLDFGETILGKVAAKKLQQHGLIENKITNVYAARRFIVRGILFLVCLTERRGFRPLDLEENPRS